MNEIIIDFAIFQLVKLAQMRKVNEPSRLTEGRKERN